MLDIDGDVLQGYGLIHRKAHHIPAGVQIQAIGEVHRLSRHLQGEVVGAVYEQPLTWIEAGRIYQSAILHVEIPALAGYGEYAAIRLIGQVL